MSDIPTDLEKEAEGYVRNINTLSGYEGISLCEEDTVEINAFIAGANSSHVKQQIIKGKIEVVTKIIKDAELCGNYEIPCMCLENELKAELKQLETPKR